MVIFVFLYILQETVFESELVNKSSGLKLKEGKEKAKKKKEEEDDRSSLVIFENDREYTAHYFIILISVDGNCWSMGAAVAAERENFDALLSRVI